MVVSVVGAAARSLAVVHTPGTIMSLTSAIMNVSFWRATPAYLPTERTSALVA